MNLNIDKMDEPADEIEESVKVIDQKMDLLVGMEHIEDPQECVIQLLQSVSEVRTDYQNLRKELVEVQTLQRELSTRLRHQLQQVHGRFMSLKEKITSAPPR